jgi:hypothetical protein
MVAGGSSITTPVSVPNGGTGATALLAYAVITGGTTATNQVQQVPGVGNIGNPLTSGGAGAVPSFGASAPLVFALTDAATILVDASLGNLATVTLGGSRTMGAPSNAARDGQPLVFELKQDVSGSRIVTWTTGAGGYTFGAVSAPTLSTSGGVTDEVVFRYSSRVGKWLYQGSQLGFS